MTQPTPRLWAVLPAGGIGQRFGADTPKQYHEIAGRMVIEWALEPFRLRDDIAGIVVVCQADLPLANQLKESDPRVRLAGPGSERAASVLSALKSLEGEASADDWVLVHDAVRPCVDPGDLDRLIGAVRNDGAGGLLATPVHDTLKRDAGDGRVVSTVERRGLWRALTPQMFRFGVLCEAMTRAVDAGLGVTDEAMAVELIGERPLLVQGRADNIKITSREDMLRAESILAVRRSD